MLGLLTLSLSTKLGPRVLSVGVEILLVEVDGCAETIGWCQNFGYSRFGITQNNFNKHTI